MAQHPSKPRVDAAILAGGHGRRMAGEAKALLRVGGRRIVERQVEALAPLVGEVLLVVADPAPYRDVAGVRLLTDRVVGRGPLGGLDAALAASSADALLVVACDLPLLAPPLLQLLRDHAPGAAAVVPRVGGWPQPLLARYGRAAEAPLAARLAAGRLALLGLLDDLAPVWLDEPALRGADPALRSFLNVNTPEDHARAERAAGAGG